MLVFGILGEHRPGGAHVLVRQGHRSLTFATALDDGPQPWIFSRLGLLHVIHISACTRDQYGTQASVSHPLAVTVPLFSSMA